MHLSIGMTVSTWHLQPGKKCLLTGARHPDIKEHATLEPPLDNIEKDSVQICCGYDGLDYYRVVYEIRAAYFSAHCEYSLWYNGIDHGSVKVDYA